MEIVNEPNRTAAQNEIQLREPPKANEIAAKIPQQSAAPETPQETQPERLTEILKSYGYKASEKNLEMLRLLLENEIPLTKENVQKMNQALKLTDSSDKALFLFLNGIPLTQSNAAALDAIVSGGFKITEQLRSLIETLIEIKDPELKAQLLKIFSPLINTGANETDAARTSENVASRPAQQEAGAVISQAGSGDAQGAQQLNPPRAPAAEIFPPNAQTQKQAQNVPYVLNIPPQSENDVARQTPVQINISTNQSADAIPPNISNFPSEIPPQIAEAPPAQNPQAPDEKAKSQMSAAQAGFLEKLNSYMKEDFLSQIVKNMSQQQAAPAEHPRREAAQPPRSSASFNFAAGSPAEIDRFVNSLREILRDAQRMLSESQNRADSPDTARVARQIQVLSDRIDFVAQMRQPLYAQIPAFAGESESLAELYVYRDGKRAKQKKDSAGSVLISLDTAGLGRFETYLQKSGGSVTCRFRLRDKKIEALVRNNINKLNALLREKNLSLEAYSFVPPGERHTILDSPEAFEGSVASAESGVNFILDKKV